jgi:hypothetical protein
MTSRTRSASADRESFGDDLHTRLEVIVTDCRILGVCADEQDFEGPLKRRLSDPDAR